MAITRAFQDMLNEYLPNELLREELVRRNYLLNKVEKDDSWLGGNLVVPFEGAPHTNMSFNELIDVSSLSRATHVRGGVSGHKNAWGSLVFNDRDLMEHGAISEQNLLKILPGEVDRAMDVFSDNVSVNLLNGPISGVSSAADVASGQLTVDNPERLYIGQLVTLKDTTGTGPTDFYIIGINMNTKVVTFSSTFGGSATALTGFDDTTTIYHIGADVSGQSFTSLRDSLLSSANGGSSTLYGQTKTSYPYLQAINVSGADITAVNIMEKLFDALTTIRQRGKGAPTDLVMSYKNMGSCLKNVEFSKGAFNVTPGSRKASQYGWTELEIGSVTKGGLNLVGVQEMDDDVVHVVDWRALKFYSNGMIRKRRNPGNGNEFYETRGTSGFTYIVDFCLFGDLILQRPSYCGVVHSISY